MATIHQLQNTLKRTYGIVPAVAGFDKFTNLLTNRADYPGRNAGISTAVYENSRKY